MSMGSSIRQTGLFCWRGGGIGMLFVVSAGNDGRNLDKHRSIQPATLENMVTVTLSDDFGRIGRGSNVGAGTVDIMVPAERVGVFDHRGVRDETGGTSYAAPRGRPRHALSCGQS